MLSISLVPPDRIRFSACSVSVTRSFAATFLPIYIYIFWLFGFLAGVCNVSMCTGGTGQHFESPHDLISDAGKLSLSVYHFPAAAHCVSTLATGSSPRSLIHSARVLFSESAISGSQ